MDFTAAYDGLCEDQRKAGPEGGGQAGRPVPARATWYAEPVKVFDNLYYVGMKNNSAAWALTTSGGIILFDATEDYAVEAEVVEGLKKMGLDAKDIKYDVITAARSSSFGGAKDLQEHFNTHILVSEADWDTIAKSNVNPAIKPKKDMVVTDGQKLTLGDTTVMLYLTPGHTPGTVSMIIPARDGNQKHVATFFGGRDPGLDADGLRYFPTLIEAVKLWKASANRFMDIATKAGADVWLETRPNNIHGQDRLHAMSYRVPGTPHPFVNKEAIRRFLTMISECMDAQLAWIASE
jgi:metallo-beta-lactamase class B